MKKKNIIGKLLFRLLCIAIVFFILVLAFASNYMVDIGIKRGCSASEAISASLEEAETEEQRELEAQADALRQERAEAARTWGSAAYTEMTQIVSEDGLRLNGYLFINEEKQSHDWAVVTHGYNGNAQRFWDIAKVYADRGWNVLTPDLRAFGKSGGTYVGMGWLDRRDLICWVREILRIDPQAHVVLHGFSMGAAAIMMASGEDDFPAAVFACIEDAGYSSDWEEMADKLQKIYHMSPFPLLYTASILTKLKAGYSIREADCIPQLHKNRTPMLFIHGDKDDYNPFYMLDKVYEADACAQKEKLVVLGARHVMSAYVDPELYWDTIWRFIERYRP